MIIENRVHVAPHAGAWIETKQWRLVYGDVDVAPHAGAWIETKCYGGSFRKTYGSRPTRARGLKLVEEVDKDDESLVAPHAGAWIETGVR